MPATQRGQVDGSKGRFRLRWYDAEGNRHSKQPFKSKSAAWDYFREIQSAGGRRADVTLSEFIPTYLERHGASVRPRTVTTLTERLRHAEAEFGTVPLRALESMVDQVAAWQAKQPDGIRYGRVGALRQTLEAAVRWGYMASNPAKAIGKNRQPPPRSIRAFTRLELDAIAAELSPAYAPLPIFAAATGLRPEEWQALERRDVDRSTGVLTIRRTVSGGQVVELGKTTRSRRQVPLSPRALAALDALPPRLDTPLLFPAAQGGVLHLDNFRRRVWAPAVDSAGLDLPARIYDMRSTFASNALAAGVAVFELARVMGTSVEMIERHYGALLDGAGAGIAARLASFERSQESIGSGVGREAVSENP